METLGEAIFDIKYSSVSACVRACVDRGICALIPLKLLGYQHETYHCFEVNVIRELVTPMHGAELIRRSQLIVDYKRIVTKESALLCETVLPLQLSYFCSVIVETLITLAPVPLLTLIVPRTLLKEQ